MIYLNKRLHENKMYPQENREPGPVITISREVGCGGVKLAKMLAEELNHNFAICKSWRVLSKEIFQESAKELNMEMSKLNKILKESDRNTFDEILAAFGDKHYKSERIIRKTVIEDIP
jgi:cytidylate kinase